MEGHINCTPFRNIVVDIRTIMNIMPYLLYNKLGDLMRIWSSITWWSPMFKEESLFQQRELLRWSSQSGRMKHWPLLSLMQRCKGAITWFSNAIGSFQLACSLYLALVPDLMGGRLSRYYQCRLISSSCHINASSLRMHDDVAYLSGCDLTIFNLLGSLKKGLYIFL